MSLLPMAEAPATPQVEIGTDAQRFVVDGMDCASCARTVQKVAAGLDGVEAVEVSFGNATMSVAGTAAAASIEAAVARAGFGARPVGRPRPVQAPLRDFPRPALHAWKLAFRHPASGELLRFEAAVPRDLRELWERVAGRGWP